MAEDNILLTGHSSGLTEGKKQPQPQMDSASDLGGRRVKSFVLHHKYMPIKSKKVFLWEKRFWPQK